MKKLIKHVPLTEPLITLASDIAYAHVPYWYGTTVRPLQLNLLMPKDRKAVKAPMPLLVFFCGGGVQVTHKDIWLPEMVYFAKCGFIVACPEYRTYNDAVFPAQLIDAKAAIRFLRAHAETFCIDPNRVAVAGESAGGNIAITAGIYSDNAKYDQGDYLDQSSAVQAVVNYYGGGGERTERWHATQRQLEDGARTVNTIGASLGGTPEQIPEVYREASMLYHVKPGLPPMMILHGTGDALSPIELADPLYDAMLAAGNVCEFYTFEGADHGDAQIYQPPIKDMVIEFLNRTM